ncbi:MAG: prephenate dehydratase [Spirochaetes bacterium]|nr:prephenate dehydratase [Spirochaetota bacterium]
MSIENHRDAINDIDAKIIELINDRTSHVIEIGKIKHVTSSPIYNPKREKEILERIEKLSQGKKFPVPVLRMIFREIMSASREIERPLSVAYLGPEGTFTHNAAINQFGSSTTFTPLKTIGDVFKEVEVAKYDYGVVPIENSNEGAVNHTLDMFINSNLKIRAETYLGIHHCLLSSSDDIKSIKKIYSHPQSFGQCRLWILNNFPNAELIESTSNSEAAKVSAWDKYGAAIAGKINAELYGLTVIAENIEDNPENYTRFLTIGHEDSEPSQDDKTSLIVAIKDKPGALQSVLSVFSTRNINMNKIESRPTKKKAWEYLFYIDIDGHREDTNIIETLKDLEAHTTFLKVLGSYPKMKIF